MSDDEDGEAGIAENMEEMYADEADIQAVIEAEMEEADEEKEYANSNVCEELVLDDADRMTSDRVSMLEYTEITGIRAEDIARHDNCFVSIDGLTDPIKMAEREFAMRKCPLRIKRELGFKVIDGKSYKVVEYLDPNTAIHPAKSMIDLI